MRSAGTNETKEEVVEQSLRITIIVILGLLVIATLLFLPALRRATKAARIAQAKTDIAILIAAISAYETTYAHYPLSSNDTNAPDFTFGTIGTSDEAVGITNSFNYQANNSEAIIALMDLTSFPDGRPTFNADHGRNPQNIVFLAVKMTSNTNSPGLGPDYVYRDPWGHPYIITIDRNNDKKCRDAFYKLASVSETASATHSHAYLVRTAPPPYDSDEARDSFEVPNATVTVWSFGPDGKADKNQKANEGVNKDNITSW